MPRFTTEGTKVFVDDLVWDIYPTESEAKEQAERLNNCTHEERDRPELDDVDTISMVCSRCGAITTFAIPSNLEWT